MKISRLLYAIGEDAKLHEWIGCICSIDIRWSIEMSMTLSRNRCHQISAFRRCIQSQCNALSNSPSEVGTGFGFGFGLGANTDSDSDIPSASSRNGKVFPTASTTPRFTTLMAPMLDNSLGLLLKFQFTCFLVKIYELAACQARELDWNESSHTMCHQDLSDYHRDMFL